MGDLGEAKNLSYAVGETFVGTLQYMSPELKTGRQFDDQLGFTTHLANTDIWFVLTYFLIYQ